MSEINNCSICKLPPEVLQDDIPCQGRFYQIACRFCKMRGPISRLRTKAISLWNMMEVKQYEEQ